MKHIQVFEQFKDMPMEKPGSESLSVNESEKSHEDIMEVINFIKYNLETMDIGAEEAIVFITNAKSKMPWLLSKPNGETTQEWKELIDWISNKYPQLNRMSNILSKELKPWQKNLNGILKQPMWPRPEKSQMN